MDNPVSQPEKNSVDSPETGYTPSQYSPVNNIPDVRPENRGSFHPREDSDDEIDDFDPNAHLDPTMKRKLFKDKVDIAWISLFAIIAETIYALAFISPEKLSFYDNILSWSMSIFASLVLGYFGATSYIGGKAIRNIRNNKNGPSSTY